MVALLFFMRLLKSVGIFSFVESSFRISTRVGEESMRCVYISSLLGERSRTATIATRMTAAAVSSGASMEARSKMLFWDCLFASKAPDAFCGAPSAAFSDAEFGADAPVEGSDVGDGCAAACLFCGLFLVRC